MLTLLSTHLVRYFGYSGRNIPDEIEKNGNGYLKANVSAPVLDKHEYTCMNSLDVDTKAEYVNVGSKDHPEHS